MTTEPNELEKDLILEGGVIFRVEVTPIPPAVIDEVGFTDKSLSSKGGHDIILKAIYD